MSPRNPFNIWVIQRERKRDLLHCLISYWFRLKAKIIPYTLSFLFSLQENTTVKMKKNHKQETQEEGLRRDKMEAL